MTKTEKLKSAYKELQDGKIIEFKSEKGKNYNVRCWIRKSETNNRNYIFWRNFGQSANRMTLGNLRWIAKTIGHCFDYEYKIVNSIYED